MQNSALSIDVLGQKYSWSKCKMNSEVIFWENCVKAMGTKEYGLYFCTNPLFSLRQEKAFDLSKKQTANNHDISVGMKKELNLNYSQKNLIKRLTLILSCNINSCNSFV